MLEFGSKFAMRNMPCNRSWRSTTLCKTIFFCKTKELSLSLPSPSHICTYVSILLAVKIILLVNGRRGAGKDEEQGFGTVNLISTNFQGRPGRRYRD